MNGDTIDPTLYDREAAIRIAGGNAKIAAELLTLLLRDLPLQQTALQQAFDAGDWPKLKELSHKLHGSARYCGTPALKTTTALLDDLLASGAADTRVEPAFRRVLAEIQRLLTTPDLPVG